MQTGKQSSRATTPGSSSRKTADSRLSRDKPSFEATWFNAGLVILGEVSGAQTASAQWGAPCSPATTLYTGGFAGVCVSRRVSHAIAATASHRCEDQLTLGSARVAGCEHSRWWGLDPLAVFYSGRRGAAARRPHPGV